MPSDDFVSPVPALYEAPPHLVDAYHACRQQVLIETFLREASDGAQPCDRARLEELAERLIDRYSEDVLNDLLIVADRIPPTVVAAWVRSHFSRALGQFGMALRSSAPEGLRHGISQVLQVSVLTAEHRMNAELSAWLGSAESAAVR